MKNNLPVTKSDLDKAVAKLATKEELKKEVAKLATKDELKKAVAKLATKEELKAAVAKLATKNELEEKLSQTESILRTEIRLTAEETKEEIREEIKQSSSKILNVLDSFLGEIKTSQEERTISAHQLRDHDERITVLEQKTGIAAI